MYSHPHRWASAGGSGWPTHHLLPFAGKGNAADEPASPGAYVRVMTERRSHWDGVYAAKTPESVSWRQDEPSLSLALISETGLPLDAPILDVGAGATLLLDRLLARGHTDISALDISEAALTHVKARLGPQAAAIAWHVADVTGWRPPKTYALWHDRAVLHFLTNPADQRAYADVLRSAVRPGGHVIISGFAPGGPDKCSGLPVVQHDAESLKALLGAGFSLRKVRDETHLTPWGAEQAFRYHVFERA